MYKISDSFSDMTKEEKRFADRIELNSKIQYKSEKFTEDALKVQNHEVPYSIASILFIAAMLFGTYFITRENSDTLTLQQGLSEPSSTSSDPIIVIFLGCIAVAVVAVNILSWLISNAFSYKNKAEISRIYYQGVADSIEALTHPNNE